MTLPVLPTSPMTCRCATLCPLRARFFRLCAYTDTYRPGCRIMMMFPYPRNLSLKRTLPFWMARMGGPRGSCNVHPVVEALPSRTEL